MWAMEMHPDDRPESLRQFQQALLGDGRRPQRKSRDDGGLSDAVRANSLLLLVALALFLLAVLLTVL